MRPPPPPGHERRANCCWLSPNAILLSQCPSWGSQLREHARPCPPWPPTKYIPPQPPSRLRAGRPLRLPTKDKQTHRGKSSPKTPLVASLTERCRGGSRTQGCVPLRAPDTCARPPALAWPCSPALSPNVLQVSCGRVNPVTASRCGSPRATFGPAAGLQGAPRETHVTPLSQYRGHRAPDRWTLWGAAGGACRGPERGATPSLVRQVPRPVSGPWTVPSPPF